MIHARKGFTIVELGISAMVMVAIFGFGCWVMNLVKLCKCDFDAPYKGEVIHAVGVFVPPTAVITVWFNDK